MKKTLLFTILLVLSCVSVAQNNKSKDENKAQTKSADQTNVAESKLNILCNDSILNDSLVLNEVVVNSSRTNNMRDALRIFPTDRQKENSATAYGLLSKLSLPFVTVDEVARTITVPNNMGIIQIRINDIVATENDLASLDISAVKYIDFIRNPGVRYGQNVNFVIDIIMKKAVSGYVVGADLMHALTYRNCSDKLFAKFNFGKSEFSLNYSFGFSDKRKSRYEETARYLMPDNSYYYIKRVDKERRQKTIGQDFQLRYSLSDVGRYVLQATLGGNFSSSPENFIKRENIYNGEGDIVTINSSDKSFSPNLDVYYNQNIGHNQTITVNATGAHTAASYSWLYGGVSPYGYNSDGDSWSFLAEGIYENRMPLFTFSSGLQYAHKSVCNTYAGDVSAINSIKNSQIYVFAQVKGSISVLDYTLGVGVSQLYYRQSAQDYSYCLWRPDVSLSYPFLEKFRIRYYLRMYQHPPRLEYLGDVEVRNNEMEVSKGNSALYPARVVEQSFAISYQLPSFYAEIETYYRNNHHCVMSQINRVTDDDGNTNFVFSRDNQRRISMFYVNGYSRFEIVPDKLSFTATGGFFRFFNYGNLYKHHYSAFNGAFRITAYLGNFTLSADASNGWSFLEGESRADNTYTYNLTASYKYKNFNLSLRWQNGLLNDVVQHKAWLVNRFISKEQRLVSGEMGNMITLSLSFRFSKGRKYETIEHNVRRVDDETGIKKGD